jgi:hypothetical protein
VFAETTFVVHADFLHDAPRGQIVAEMVSMDAVQAKFGEREV